jgi:alpha-tubulin suppressor-like RCC1 family protein
VKYDHLNIKFVNFSVHGEHAMGIDHNGKLWAWGNNGSKRCGLPEEIYDGVFEPRQVKFLEAENFKPIKVECGFDHTLLLVEDSTGDQKLLSIG